MICELLRRVLKSPCGVSFTLRKSLNRVRLALCTIWAICPKSLGVEHNMTAKPKTDHWSAEVCFLFPVAGRGKTYLELGILGLCGIRTQTCPHCPPLH